MIRRVTLAEIARAAKVSTETVWKVLWEIKDVKITRNIRERVFQSARRLGYDLPRLKIAKRIVWRKEVMQEIMDQIKHHPEWDREGILRYLSNCIRMVDRVYKRLAERSKQDKL